MEDIKFDGPLKFFFKTDLSKRPIGKDYEKRIITTN